MADPVTAVPEEAVVGATVPPERALRLLERPGFRRTYVAVVTSELGDAFHYIALMWFALATAGPPLGVVAVRLADSVPALLFGLHGGLVADRRDRRRTLILADVVRGAVLVPIAVAGLAGELMLWMLVVAAFVLETATSYFQPAYGALLPTLVERRNVQAANGLVRATAEAVRVGGWAAAAGLLVFMPLSTFFLLNAATFFFSAALLTRVRAHGSALAATPRIREGFAALRPRPLLATAVGALAVGVTIGSGAWIVGVPELVHTTLDLGAGSFSAVAAGYGAGAVAAGLVLARVRVPHKARTSYYLWLPYAAGYTLFALAGSLTVAIAAGAITGATQAALLILLYSAAQEEIPDALLGRVVGLISLVHRGAHATGLILVAPLFAVFATRTVFWGAALTLPLIGIVSLVAVAATPARARR